MPGLGRFLGGGSFVVYTGGCGYVKHHLKPGDLIRSCALPYEGVYEVDSSCEPCNVENCRFQGARVRRVDMGYLTEEQTKKVKDVSQRLEGVVG